MQEWASLLGNVGFPVLVSMYLLIRIEGKLEQLSTTISQLSSQIAKMHE